MFFFFFKQKTAYEMRISDWSSDVCSSDLVRDSLAQAGRGSGGKCRAGAAHDGDTLAPAAAARSGRVAERDVLAARAAHGDPAACGRRQHPAGLPSAAGGAGGLLVPGGRRNRSEEHTSELQSLMRISYAVFCLK